MLHTLLHCYDLLHLVKRVLDCGRAAERRLTRRDAAGWSSLSRPRYNGIAQAKLTTGV
jgi:hypothetical protein